ncbi:MAG TPA: CoA-transferase [Syntrophales bacterium]|nr:CoA-transferase [Syntrophales bacterium]HOL58814.1 CoA-transferase [Syntrophales bacterium]HPO35141.1 CoA-transferase [Syntrophales bacterium]
MKNASDMLETFALREEREDKVMTIREAIKRFIHPGQQIHVAVTHNCSYAALHEIMRQFHHKNPRFTLIMRGIRDTAVLLLHLGLVKKVLTAFSGNVYPWYGPNRVVREVYEKKEVELEEWTILTLPLRLMAAALGLPFVPTRSLVNSDLAKMNEGNFLIQDDPFGGEPIGLVRALSPDISIVHGLAADRAGNTILTAPYSESVWGAKASKNGVIVTVEKLVSTEFIRAHSHLVKIPAYMVRSVSVEPFGAHPGGMWVQKVEGLEGYGEDYAFMAEFNALCQDPAALDRWTEEWILKSPSFDAYLKKLGKKRLKELAYAARADYWQKDLKEVLASVGPKEPSPAELMVITAARKLVEIIPHRGYRTILAGAGTANLAAWTAKYLLERNGYEAELMVELGYFGNSPRPGEPFLLNYGNFHTCKMMTDTLDTLGVFTGGGYNRCIGVLGGGQVDKTGNVNSSWPSRDRYLTGSGGANDVASGAAETMVIMSQSRDRFLSRVPFVTAPGKRVRVLISQYGLYEKQAGEDEFTLTGYLRETPDLMEEEAVRRIKETCGWDLKVASHLKPIGPPQLEELTLLRMFDPHRYYLK